MMKLKADGTFECSYACSGDHFLEAVSDVTVLKFFPTFSGIL